MSPKWPQHRRRTAYAVCFGCLCLGACRQKTTQLSAVTTTGGSIAAASDASTAEVAHPNGKDLPKMAEPYQIEDPYHHGFAQWFGKTQATSTRFHHRIRAPKNAVQGRQILSVAEPSPAPEDLYAQHWTLAKAAGGGPWCILDLTEAPSVQAAHAGLTWRLNNISMGGIDLGPVPGAPGDVTVLWHMARDNVRVDGGAANHDPGPDGLARDTAVVHSALAAVDEILLSNWPLIAARESGATPEPLQVDLSIPQRVAKDELARLAISVRRADQELPLDRLSFRVLMEPGRLRWESGQLWFWSSEVGPATITVDVFAEPNAYGQGVTKTEVGG